MDRKLDQPNEIKRLLGMAYAACEMFVEMEDKKARVCCPDCAEWNDAKELCGKFEARPPAMTIAKGCPHWSWNEIPF